MLPPTFISSYHDESSVSKIEYKTIGKTDMVVSNLSFGASSLGGVFRKTDDQESVKLVEEVVKSGINYIDTAPWYGQGRSESVLGMAFKNIPRGAYYVATKVGRYELDYENMFDFTREKTIKSVEKSLERLGLDYIDLIQVHDLEFCHDFRQLVKFTIPALQELKKAGKVRYIGLTGYSLDSILRLISLLPEGSIDTVLTYCRATLIDQTLLGSPISYLQDKGIGVINASPVSMGLLSNRGPPAWHPATTNIKIKSKEAAEWCASQGLDITDIAVQWSLALEQIPTTLISTANPENMRRNIQLAKTTFSETNKKLAQTLIQDFFQLLPQNNWENIEVENYWKQMVSASIKQKSNL